MTLTFELDLWTSLPNIYIIGHLVHNYYLGIQTDRHTHIRPIALPGPLNLSVNNGDKTVIMCFVAVTVCIITALNDGLELWIFFSENHKCPVIHFCRVSGTWRYGLYGGGLQWSSVNMMSACCTWRDCVLVKLSWVIVVVDERGCMFSHSNAADSWSGHSSYKVIRGFCLTYLMLLYWLCLYMYILGVRRLYVLNVK